MVAKYMKLLMHTKLLTTLDYGGTLHYGHGDLYLPRGPIGLTLEESYDVDGHIFVFVEAIEEKSQAASFRIVAH